MAASTSTKTIRVVVDSSQAAAGVQNINRQLASLGVSIQGVNGSAVGLGGSLGGVGNASGRAAGSASALTSRFGGLGAAAQAAGSQMVGMGGAITGLPLAGLALGITAGVGALVAFGSAAVSASAKFEQYRASLTTVLGSTEQAGIAFDKMQAFAAKTPFALDQAVNGFIKLKALGLAPSEAALTSYGNTASAMGKDLNQMIEAVADASTGEFERLKEFGIKSSKSGNDVAFTFQGVTTKIKNNSAEIQDYLQKIGNTNFAGAMERQAATFSGAMSNLEDTVTQTFAKIGDGGLTTAMGSVVRLLTDGLVSITPALVGIGNAMAGMINGVVAIGSGLGSIFSSLNAGSGQSITLVEGLSLAFNAVGFALETVGKIAGAVLGGMGTIIGTTARYLGDQFGAAIAFTGASFSTGGRSWSNSIFGIINAVRTVVTAMPALFSIAINDVSRMFRALGNQISKVWEGVKSGDLGAIKAAMNTDVSGSFANTKRAAMSIGRMGNAAYADQGAAERTKNAWLGRDVKKDGALNMAANAASPAAAGKDDKADKAAKDAERKAKAEAEFWKTLQGELETSKLFGIEAQKLTKEKELQKALERDLTSAEKTRVDTMVQDIANTKAVTALKQKTFELQNAAAIEAQRAVGLTESQKAVEDTLFAARLANKNAGVDIATKDYQIAEAAWKIELERNQALADRIKLQNDLVKTGTDYAKASVDKYGTVDQRRAQVTKTRDDTLAALNAAKGKGLSADLFQAGVKRATAEFEEGMARVGSNLANVLGVIRDIADRIGGKAGRVLNTGTDAFEAFKGYDTTAKATYDKFTEAFGTGDLAKNIGKSVGGAFAGLGIGEKIGQLGSALGIKGFDKGAGIGGALGGAIGSFIPGAGPIASAIGSVLGGTISALLTKTKSGGATITGGGAGDIALSGNSGAFKKVASGLAGSVQGGLAEIAAKLGGSVGSFGGITIGKRGDDFRVNTTGSTSLKGKRGATDFGDDEGAAIAFAIKTAVERGAITGLSDIVGKALSSMGAEGAIAFAESWNKLTADMDALTDPIGAAVRAITNPLDAMRKTMVEIGASTADLTKVDEYRSRKLKEVLASQTQTITDFMNSLRNDTGQTAMQRLTADLAKFEEYKTKIASGDASIDQSAFTSLGESIKGLTKDVYGTATGESQSIFAMLTSTSQGLLDNVTRAFNTATGDQTSTSTAVDATTAAIDAQTAALVTQNATMIEYLSQIAANSASGGSNDNYAYGGGGSVNGRYNVQSY